MNDKKEKNSCPNCGKSFDPAYQFCPHCGQQNKSIDLHFKYFIHEFLSASFNLDSKIFQTLKLLIFYPGKLTKEFIEGRRKAYLPPIRLYLVVSLVYFTLLSFMNSDIIKISQSPEANNEQRVLYGANDKDSVMLTVPEAIDTLFQTNRDKIFTQNTKIKSILGKMSTREGRKEFKKRLPNYISVGMFILVPLTALIFYMLFFKNTLYIQHLVFTIHLQSLMYILFIFVNLFELVVRNDYVESINALLFIFILLIWIKRFYEINWLKTVWKTIVFLFFYGILFVFFLGIVAGINVWSL